MAEEEKLYQDIFFPHSNSRIHPDDQLLGALHYIQAGFSFDANGSILRTLGRSDAVLHGFSRKSNSTFRNIAVVRRPARLIPALKSIEMDFKFQKRDPILYLREGDGELEEELEENGWRKVFREVVMTREDVPDSSTLPGTVYEARSRRQIRTFTNVLGRAHQDSDTNPYGPTSRREKHDIARALKNRNGNDDRSKMNGYIVFDGGNVAVASVKTNTRWENKRWGGTLGGIGYIENVGTPPGHRGHHYAEHAVAACIEESFNQGATLFCLTTAADAGTKIAFEKTGWQPRIYANVWEKQAGAAA